jgi:hypothetical protein
MKHIVWGAVLLFVITRVEAIDVLTQKLNPGRTGANLSETTLKLSNVNVNTFGKIFERGVDGELYAQPLIVENVNVGGGTHSVVYLVTARNVAYAYDAVDGAVTSPYWTVNFGTPVPQGDVQCCCTDVSSWIGTLGTPVIDTASSSIYFVTKHKDLDGTYHLRLRALDIRTGVEKAGSPKEITATAAGTGIGSVNGVITFDAKLQNQRPGLLLQGGKLYIAFSSHNDCGNYHGWVLAYDAATLNQVSAFNNTPDGGQAGIWMSGGGPVGDGNNVYVTTGNGSFTADTGGRNYAMSFIGLSSTLNVTTWFTPSDWRGANGRDLDLGGCGVMMIPNTRLLVSGGKNGTMYVVNADSMGGLGGQVQSFSGGGGHIHGGPVHFKGAGASDEFIYVGPENTTLHAFRLVNGTFNTTAAWQSSTAPPNGMPGWQASVSANGTADGIVWATRPFSGNANHDVVPGIVHAFNAITGQELWTSKQNAARDDVGTFAKNPSPTVANGRVYVPTFSGKLAVYGLLSGNTNPPPPPPPVGTGTGLKGDYYNNADFTAFVLSRTDPTVNFDWGQSAPAAGVQNNTFSVRWTGFVQPQFGESYTFYTQTDDGVRLWVNGVLLIDHWADQAGVEWSGSITLTAGQKYSIQMDYYDNTGHALAKLSWSSSSTPKAIIPQTQLYPQ